MIEIKARGDKKQYSKYPRTKIANRGGDRRADKLVLTDWYNGYRYDYSKVRRFLQSNIGRPYSNILSELKAKLGKSVVSITPMEILRDNVYKSKDEIPDRWGGFYWSNNILNYKKPKKVVIDHSKKSKWRIAVEYNRENFPSNKELYILSKEASSKGKAMIGKFYVKYHDTLYFTNIYLVPFNSLTPYNRVSLVEMYEDSIGVKVYSTQFNSQCFRPQYIVDWYTRFHMSLPPYVFVAKKLSDKQIV